MSALNTLISIVMFRTGPQDLPYSQGLLQLLIVLYIISGVMAFGSLIETDIAMMNMIADVLVIMFYSYTVLGSTGRKPRFRQTVTAMIGVGVLFHLMAWPMLLQTEAGQKYLQQNDLAGKLSRAAHVVWATGGSMVPQPEMESYYQRGLFACG